MNLRERYREIRYGLGLADDPLAREVLLAHYAEPHRHYHTIEHIEECLGLLDRVQVLAERPAEVAFALLYHDAVYDPRYPDNEAKSATMAATDLRNADATTLVIDRIKQMILATATHDAHATKDSALLLDIDLSILGADEARFDRYERDVRREYAFVPEAAFRTGRVRILERFLARPSIYATSAMRALLEDRARANVSRSVKALCQ